MSIDDTRQLMVVMWKWSDWSKVLLPESEGWLVGVEVCERLNVVHCSFHKLHKSAFNLLSALTKVTKQEFWNRWIVRHVLESMNKQTVSVIDFMHSNSNTRTWLPFVFVRLEKCCESGQNWDDWLIDWSVWKKKREGGQKMGKKATAKQIVGVRWTSLIDLRDNYLLHGRKSMVEVLR